MSKNFKTSAAAAFISGMVTSDAEPVDEDKTTVAIPVPDVPSSPALSEDALSVQAPLAEPEATHRINGKDVVVIYRRPRKGDKVERRTRQAHLLMLPSLYKETQKFAKANGISFNALVEDALIYYLEQHQAK